MRGHHTKKLTFVQIIFASCLIYDSCVPLCSAFNTTSSIPLAYGLRQVKYCGAAYCTDPSFKSSQVQEWSCNACKESPHLEAKIFSGGTADANGFVGYEKRSNEIIVAFSGTDAVSKKNWIEDFDFPLIDFPHCSTCKVHNGFYLTYLSVSKEIRTLINGFKALHPTALVSITGHSLGAALASIAIADLSADESYSSSLIKTGHFVFGSPRIGNKPFSEWYTTKASLTFRVVHGKDPVPHVPLQKMDFHHVPYEVQ